MSRRAEFSNPALLVFLSVFLMGTAVRAALPQALTADRIIEKNIAARGGLEAWHKIQSMTMTGKMDAGTKKNVQLPFVMTLKKPRMSRLELDFAGKKALQVYDGRNGWKVRPFLGRNEVESYTPDELRLAAEQMDLDGYLIDHSQKGISAEVEDIEPVEGHNAYKLKLTMKDGQTKHLWVDAGSFLETKVEGAPRRLDGKMHNVEIYYRDYRSVGSLKIPFVMETAVEKVQTTRKIILEAVTLNPKLDESAFAKPEIAGIHDPKTAQQNTIQATPGRAMTEEARNEQAQ
jgi:hypothetical protein